MHTLKLDLFRSKITEMDVAKPTKIPHNSKGNQSFTKQKQPRSHVAKAIKVLRKAAAIKVLHSKDIIGFADKKLVSDIAIIENLLKDPKH